jgi:hypothetical protein
VRLWGTIELTYSLIDLSFAIRDILDYIIANFVVLLEAKSAASKSFQFMVYHNDCQFIGYKCQLWLQLQANKNLTENAVVDLTLRFQNLSLAFFNSVIVLIN